MSIFDKFKLETCYGGFNVINKETGLMLDSDDDGNPRWIKEGYGVVFDSGSKAIDACRNLLNGKKPFYIRDKL